jgi:hypothetical protein
MVTSRESVQAILDAATKANASHSSDFSTVYSGIVQLQQIDRSNSTQFGADMSELSRRLHQSGILNDFEITGVDSMHHLVGTKNGKTVDIVAANISDTFSPGQTHESTWQEIKNVAAQIGDGAKDEITHHLGRVAASAGIGFGIGCVGVFLAPELAAGVAIGGAALAAYKLYEHLPHWIHDSKVAAQPELYSSNEVKAADKGMQSFGAGGVDLAAGVAGGIAGGYTGHLIKASLASGAAGAEGDAAATPEPTDGKPNVSDSVNRAHMQHGNVANATAQVRADGAAAQPVDPTQVAQPGHIGDPTGGAASQVVGDPTSGAHTGVVAHAHLTQVVAGQSGDSTQGGGGLIAESTVPADVPTSIARTQSLFRAAASDDCQGVFQTQKQAYDVLLRKILEPGTVQTLENRAGEAVQPGQWIATRLNADGTPVMEDGIVNQWPVVPKTILKTYQATPDQLASATELVAGTKTDGPLVHMINLLHDTTIKTPWGEMSGKAGDWLANYDYDAATAAPGQDYAIVTQNSFRQTYQIVPKKS